jgi:hypothetical protein
MTGSVQIRASATDKGSQQLMRLKQSSAIGNYKTERGLTIKFDPFGKVKSNAPYQFGDQVMCSSPVYAQRGKSLHNWGSVVQCTQWRR